MSVRSCGRRGGGRRGLFGLRFREGVFHVPRAVVLDGHTSIVEGSIGAIQRRLMVADADHFRARAALARAEGEIA